MLDHLRAAALTMMAATPDCTLSTVGPAGIQAALVPCLVANDALYVLIPSGADILLNVEHVPGVVLTTPAWQLQGISVVLGNVARPACPLPAAIRSRADAAGCVAVLVVPFRMQVAASGSQGVQTIDFDPASGADAAARAENPTALTSAVGMARAEGGRRDA